MTNLDGLELYAALIRLFATLPRLDRPQALALAELAAARGRGRDLRPSGHPDRPVPRPPRPRRHHRHRPARGRPGRGALLARLAPDPQAARAWADLAQTLSARARRGKAVNLDPAALLMDMLLKIDETAGTLAAR